ncbi:uncharacterized protein RHOBADRAFT_51829 [Rhodotorula graminis WP1]|uniref:Uncharacterized protein n=1 Tax=Rhodotorula graminis (strain WP1) TaxID=578459 RepID=A0A194S8C3_RHOGW|nr:uncharacterized protein RHOBADRAFT_51829 [Rhodotorula graminis WP1]KPV76842.1 hypothetical protein RHOBADRAFT_51829 [Rhodotorula graminis WP1]
MLVEGEGGDEHWRETRTTKSGYRLVGGEGTSRPRHRLAPLFRSRLALFVLALTTLVLALAALGTATGHTHKVVAHGVVTAKEYGARLKEWARPLAPPDDEPYVAPSLDELAQIVGENPTYLVKDGWASYGFNNQRYMLESTLLLAKIARRIPVLPDSIWARSCAVDDSVCEANALRFFRHRNAHADVVGSTWNDDGPAYKLPIQLFLDLPHLRRTYGPLLTYRELIELYGIDPNLYDESLRWNTTNYTPQGYTTATVPDYLFQNRTFVRVDQPPPPPVVAAPADEIPEGLNSAIVELALGSRAVWTAQQARDALRKRGVKLDGDDDGLVRQLELLDVVPLYTFGDEVLMNKALARPSVELALRNKVQPLVDTLASPPFNNASIVYLAGNLHDQRKPGGLYFTSPAARQAYVDLVVRGVRPPAGVRALGERLAERMGERVEGRRWLAAHLRRSDFVGIKWSPAQDAEAHFDKTRAALREGVEALEAHFDERLPRGDDPFYLATDERNATALAYYRSHGAVLLSDLVTPADSSQLGPSASYMDVLAVVEQQVLARSDYFLGSELSSTSGGAVNVRTALGKEDWSWALLTRQ